MRILIGSRRLSIAISIVEDTPLKKIAGLTALIAASSFVLVAQGPPRGEFGGGPGFGRGPGGLGHDGMEQVVTGAPYSGTLIEQRQQTLADGNQISVKSETKVYRDAEGRVRKEVTRTMRSGETKTFVMLFDPVAGFAARLNPETLTAEKHGIPPQGAKARHRATPSEGEDASNVSTEDLGSKSIEGLAATGKKVTRTIPAGEMGNSEPIKNVREVWTSTLLKVPLSVTSSSPAFGTSTAQLTGISQSAPDATLFQIPSNYQVSTHQGRVGMAHESGE